MDPARCHAAHRRRGGRLRLDPGPGAHHPRARGHGLPDGGSSALAIPPHLVAPAAAPVLMMGSLAVLLLVARPPRPPWREIARRPGAVACGAALAALLVQSALVALGKVLGRVPGA